MSFYYFFFFKQKTAYEMRISDWSSDVCSSDLRHDPHLRITKLALERRRGYEAGEGEQLAQATSCFHQKVTVTQSEQESTASTHAEDGLNTGARQLPQAGVTHTNPR